MLTRTFRATLLLALALTFASTAFASDHLDTPTVIADPAADIGDLYAWTSPDGLRLNLALDIVGHRFSDRIQYVFHVDSARRAGRTIATTRIVCQFDAEGRIECWVADATHLAGDAAKEAGLTSTDGRVRVFAGLRNDPFFNNVRGTRSAYEAALTALKVGTSVDPAGCAALDQSVATEVLDRWRHTDGGPAKDFLAGWTTAALVVSIDLKLVNRGGPLLGVWASTHASPLSTSTSQGKMPALGDAVDRVGRTLTGNALIGLLDPEDMANRRKEQYNRAAPSDWLQFAGDIQRSLGLYDAFDGVCGNQWLADDKVDPSRRYRKLAELLADDRLWVDSRVRICSRYLAVEQNETDAAATDCGGRTPNYDAIDVYRSLLVTGSEHGVEDGVKRDEKVHSESLFPFLAKP